jgi:hypothetical protein
MFIMAIGMLALLTLFPLGAVSMGQALKDDRCASSASMAEQCAVAANIRHDFQLTSTNAFLTNPQTGASLPVNYTGPSYPVYVDPTGVLLGLPVLGQQMGSPGIARKTLSLSNLYVGRVNPLTAQEADRWFSLPDDISYLANGTPEPGATAVQRGRRYSWAYLLQRTRAWSDQNVQMSVVVYSNRPTDVATPEIVYSAVGDPAVNPNGVTLTFAAGAAPNVRRGGWLLDVTPTAQTYGGGAATIVNAYFYRVVNVASVSSTQLTLEVQPNLKAPMQLAAVMDNVVEVFDKGTSWQP